MPASPAAGVPHGRGHLQPLRVLLLVLRLLGGAREAVRAVRRRPARPGRGLLRGRGRQQRRLPPAARARPRDPVSRRRTGGEHRGGGPGQGHRHSLRVPRAGDGHRGSRRARQGRPGGGQQRLRARAEHRRLRPRPARAAEGRRHRDHRDPAPAAADRGPALRHDLPRALLVPVAPHDPAGARRGRPHCRRRGGAPDARRVAADLVHARRARDRAERAGRQGARRRARRRTRHRRGPRRLRGGRQRRSATTSWSS